MPEPRQLQVQRSADRGHPDSVALRLPSDIGEVEQAVELMVRHCFDGFSPCQRTTFRLRVALAEALANAILRGNREDPAKTVSVRAELFAETIRLEVADEGSGFGWPGAFPPPLPDLLDDERGRGLFIISRLADRVEFNDQGNIIWMTLPRC